MFSTTTESALTFDDVLLVPRYSNVSPAQAITKTHLTPSIPLNIPLVSAAMDTVTESKLAIAIAQAGGIGFIHRNLSPTQQAEEIKKVKRHESGILKDPITVRPDLSIRDLLALNKKHAISGFPVVLENHRVIGIVTNRDIRFETQLDQPISSIMTPQERLITIQEGEKIETAKILMHRHRLERILVVSKLFELVGLITVKDILRTDQYPMACKDTAGRLRVGAAVGVSRDTEQRLALLCDAGVDVVVVDTAHAHSEPVLKQILWIKKNYPHLPVVGGNVATADAARALVDHGADGIKVGIGPGSICTTRIVTGVGVPQISAIYNVAQALAHTPIPIIADGGVRYSGDVAKAIAAGAHCVMVGSLFAGTAEAPGEVILLGGRSYKTYRGMGSLGAMSQGSRDRYGQDLIFPEKFVPEGIEGRIPFKGSIVDVIYQTVGGLRSAMGYCGCHTISDMHDHAQFVQITASGMRESHVHGIQITKEAPNYSCDDH